MTSEVASNGTIGRRILLFVAQALVATVLLSATLVAAWVALDEPMRHAVISLDDAIELIDLPGGQGPAAFMMAFVAVLVSAVVVLVAVPLILLLPLLVAGLVCAAVLLTLAVVMALLLSPLLLLGWVVWRLSRPRPAVATITP